MVYPIIYRVSTIQGGAGFLPSTVLIESNYICSSWKLDALFLAIFLGFTMSGCSLGSSMHWFEDVGNLKGKHSGC